MIKMVIGPKGVMLGYEITGETADDIVRDMIGMRNAAYEENEPRTQGSEPKVEEEKKPKLTEDDMAKLNGDPVQTDLKYDNKKATKMELKAALSHYEAEYGHSALVSLLELRFNVSHPKNIPDVLWGEVIEACTI